MAKKWRNSAHETPTVKNELNLAYGSTGPTDRKTKSQAGKKRSQFAVFTGGVASPAHAHDSDWQKRSQFRGGTLACVHQRRSLPNMPTIRTGKNEANFEVGQASSPVVAGGALQTGKNEANLRCSPEASPPHMPAIRTGKNEANFEVGQASSPVVAGGALQTGKNEANLRCSPEASPPPHAHALDR